MSETLKRFTVEIEKGFLRLQAKRSKTLKHGLMTDEWLELLLGAWLEM